MKASETGASDRNAEPSDVAETLREALAIYAHEAWSGWMSYLFEKGTLAPDGTVTLSKDLVDRWKRQMSTCYDDLPESEKNSDLAEADKMLVLMVAAMRGT